MKMNRSTSLILFALIVVIGIVLGIRNNTEDRAEIIVPEPVVDVVDNVDIADAEIIVTDSHSIDTESSLVTWTARKKLIPNYIDAGTFAVAEGRVNFDDDMLTGGSVVIDVPSLEVTETGVGGGFSGLARDMLSGRFLDVEQYQTASFTITTVEKKNRDTFEVTGDMTIKGTTNEVVAVVDVTYAEDGTAQLAAEFEIDRTDYDITFGSDKFFDNLGDKVIDDIVLLEVVLQANRL